MVIMILTSNLLLCLGHIREAEVCHAVILWLLLLDTVGTGETTVRSRGLESATLCTIVQSSPGGAS